MKKLLPLLFIGAISSASAQVVIEEVDFATIGNVITFGNDGNISNDSLAFVAGGSGVAQTFNFSTLETDDLFEVGFYLPSSVQGGADFSTADLAVDQLGGIYAFATVGNGEVNIIGLGGDFAEQLNVTFPVIAALPATDPWTLFKFPSSINSPVLVDTAEFEGEFYSDGLIPANISQLWDPDSVRLKRTIYYSADIDADGTLTDPLGGTHSVIRMKVVETSIDTVWGWTQQNGWQRPPGIAETFLQLPSNETVYRNRYIGKEVGYYVADITTDSTGAPESGSFVSNQGQCCTGIEEIVAAGQNVLYPNPTNGNIRIRTGGDIYQLNIMDMSGKLLRTERLTVDGQTVELNGLANGLYVYQMLDEAGNVAHTGRMSVIK